MDANLQRYQLVKRYLYTIATHEIPRWLRRRYDADDAVQETLLEAWLTGKDELQWLRVALLNNIRNAIRNAVARITGKRISHQQKQEKFWSRTKYYQPRTLTRESNPSFLAMLKEGLSREPIRRVQILTGDKPSTKNQHRMIRLRAKQSSQIYV